MIKIRTTFIILMNFFLILEKLRHLKGLRSSPPIDMLTIQEKNAFLIYLNCLKYLTFEKTKENCFYLHILLENHTNQYI